MLECVGDFTNLSRVELEQFGYDHEYPQSIVTADPFEKLLDNRLDVMLEERHKPFIAHQILDGLARHNHNSRTVTLPIYVGQ